MSDPILAKTLVPHWSGHGTEKFTVYGGLHYIRGNKLPYFSLTYWQGGPNGSGGAGHEEILKHFPQFAALAALHLSDIYGKPMHSESNGWYWLAGTMPDGFGQDYHGGNSETYTPEGKRHRTSGECLAIFADHCRISMVEAKDIRETVFKEAMAAPHSRLKIAKDATARILSGMEARWMTEARNSIARHKLIVYGDYPTDEIRKAAKTMGATIA